MVIGLALNRRLMKIWELIGTSLEVSLSMRLTSPEWRIASFAFFIQRPCKIAELPLTQNPAQLELGVQTASHHQICRILEIVTNGWEKSTSGVKCHAIVPGTKE